MRPCVVVVVALVGACSSPGTATRGQKGRASFAYQALPGCQDGCNLQSFALAGDGATQQIHVSLDSGVSYASVQSSAPMVATFTGTGGDVAATTGMPGDADLILVDGGGAEVDRVTVHVAATAHLVFTSGWTGAGPTILENVPITTFAVEKRDATERLLLGANGVHWTIAGTLASQGAPPPIAPTAPATVIESQIVEGPAGMGAIAGKNGDQSFDVAVNVVSAAQLQKLVANAGTTIVGADGDAHTIVQSAVETADGSQVYGASCAWTTSDLSVEATVVGHADHLDGPATSQADLRLTKMGTYTATCTLGALTVQVPLVRSF